ncbi:hypothetical protein [Streptomyces sp. NPDC048659]|uniref:hypothetical protein n=1 Tax=Streptomyces sp. NPDC048659 TaxID=3155489 RepID=UPI00342534CC
MPGSATATSPTPTPAGEGIGPDGTARDMVIRAGQAGETLVLHTPPGAARYLATLVDATPGLDVRGCVAGNDVVLVVCRGWEGARKVLRFFRVEAES